jgi:hypothetical protein
MTISRMAVWLLSSSLGAFTLAGCETSNHSSTADSRVIEPAVARANGEGTKAIAGSLEVQRPDLSRLSYDEKSRTIKVYSLDNKSRWTLTMPGLPKGVPIQGEYKLPMTMDLDPEQITLFYTTPNRSASASVTLQEILEAQAIRAQR